MCDFKSAVTLKCYFYLCGEKSVRKPRHFVRLNRKRERHRHQVGPVYISVQPLTRESESVPSSPLNMATKVANA